MEIIPPEAAHVMSLASVDPGSGPLIPVNSALPSSTPMLVVSPAIAAGREEDEKSKINTKSAEGASDSSNNPEKEIESDTASEQRLKDNVALPLRRPSVEMSKTLITQECKLASISSCEPKSSGPVETFVTTKNSSGDKPHHVVVQKDGSKTSSALAQSISPDGANHTKTLIQVHTPSSSKTTSNTGSVVSECETNRSFQSSNPISGGQKVTLVTRQNDPDHVSIVLNPSSCSNTSTEIIATASAPASSSNSSFAPSAIKGIDSSDKVDGSRATKQETKSIESSSTTVNHDTSSTASICTTTNSSTAGSRKIKKHGRKSAKENNSTSSTDEITGSGAVSKRSRKSSSKSPVLSKPIISSSAKDKDVIKSDSIQTKSFPTESHCQRTQTGCNSSVRKVDTSGVKSDNKQEVTFHETKMCKDELKLPLKDKITLDRKSEVQHDRTLKDASRRVCSGDIELVPANVINNSILPEKEEYKIELEKDEKGLGITVAGYICEKGKITFVDYLQLLFLKCTYCILRQRFFRV